MHHRVTAYIEAATACAALKRAITEDGPTPTRLAALTLARAEAMRCYARLTGGQIGEARRSLVRP